MILSHVSHYEFKKGEKTNKSKIIYDFFIFEAIFPSS